jgi:hypothetical protein
MLHTYETVSRLPTCVRRRTSPIVVHASPFNTFISSTILANVYVKLGEQGRAGVHHHFNNNVEVYVSLPTNEILERVLKTL